jgi:WD40 repeat protein
MIGHSFTYLPFLLLLQLTIQPEDLLPQLPNPKDLQPFPTVMSMVYEGHTDMVRSLAVEPKGQYMVSGSDDLTIKGKTSLAYFSIADKILARSGCYYLQTHIHYLNLFQIESNSKVTVLLASD